MMTDVTETKADLEALTNCPNLRRLEEQLSQFNVFQVVGSTYSEDQHSNILAWLFDPSQPHGLGARFLQNWLCGVAQASESLNTTCAPASQVESWQLEEVEVRTEWAVATEEEQENRRIDILLVLTMANSDRWVVCIENKVRSTQHTGQLSAYRKIVESKFADAAHRIFVFLTKDAETPKDSAYIPVTYSLVHQALTEATTHPGTTPAPEPRILIEHYLRLLEERFIGGANAKDAALALYRNHKRAVEVVLRYVKDAPPEDGTEANEKALEIYNHNRRAIQLIASYASKSLWPHAKLPLEALIARGGSACGILPGPSDNKALIRFIPKQWDVPGNHQGQGWKSPYQILFELDLSAQPPNLIIVCNAPPSDWNRRIRQLSEEHDFLPPLGSQGSPNWARYFFQKCDVPAEFDLLIDPEQAAATIFAWIKIRLAEPDMRQIIQIIADELPHLGTAPTPPTT